MGLITLGVTYTTGEITTFMPRTGGFVRHATHFVEPALGAAVGWNFCTSKLGELREATHYPPINLPTIYPHSCLIQ